MATPRRHGSSDPSRPVVNVASIFRVFLLDGSSKALQYKEDTTVLDIVRTMCFNNDIEPDVERYFALFSVEDGRDTRLDLAARIADLDPLRTDRKLLFRHWIYMPGSLLEQSILRGSVNEKEPSTLHWMAYTDAVHMLMANRYKVSAEEAMMLGCLKLQAEAGDFNPLVHTARFMHQRTIDHFPRPVRQMAANEGPPPIENAALTAKEKRRLKKRQRKRQEKGGEQKRMEERLLAMYRKLSGMPRARAQREFMATLRTWCPLYGGRFFDAQCQHDTEPELETTAPPMFPVSVSVGPKGVALITRQPASILMHPYPRILRWVLSSDQSIFAYWVLKENTPVDPDNPEAACEVLYIVSDEVDEICHCVLSQVEYLQGTEPKLPGFEPRPPEERASIDSGSGFADGMLSVFSRNRKREASSSSSAADATTATPEKTDDSTSEDTAATGPSTPLNGSTPRSNNTTERRASFGALRNLFGKRDADEEDQGKTVGYGVGPEVLPTKDTYDAAAERRKLLNATQANTMEVNKSPFYSAEQAAADDADVEAVDCLADLAGNLSDDESDNQTVSSDGYDNGPIPNRSPFGGGARPSRHDDRKPSAVNGAAHGAANGDEDGGKGFLSGLFKKKG